MSNLKLPKLTHPERIQQIIDVLDFELDAEDMKKIKSLNSGLRICWDPSEVE